MARVARHLPGLPRDEQVRPAGLSKIVMNGHVLAYLLADAWTTGAKLQASPLLRAEAEKRKAAEFVDAFMDFLSGLRRFEVLCSVRDRVRLLEPGRELDLTASRGRAALRVRGGHPDPEPRGQRHRALPRPARIHQDLRGPDLRARLDPGALRRVRRVRAPHPPLRGPRRQVPGRRHDGHLRDRSGRPSRPPERAARRHPVPGDPATGRGRRGRRISRWA